MIADIDIIKHTFEVKYAPAEWKKNYLGWELEDQINQTKSKILEKEKVTIKDFQTIISEFFHSIQDYHVGISFYSTEMALLPFCIDGTDGKYFVRWVMKVDQNNLNTEDFFPFKVGDEILMFDGQPIDKVVKELKNQHVPHSETDQKLAEKFLTLRLGKLGQQVPKGTVTIVGKQLSTGKKITHQCEWFYFPELIQNSLSIPTSFPVAQNQPLNKHPFFYKKMSIPLYDHCLEAQNKIFNLSQQPVFSNLTREGEEQELDSYDLMGNKKSPIPVLGKVIWKNSTTAPFHAYIFETAQNKHVGYIRIPTFMGDEEDCEAFEKLIELFEKKTAGLVIDQLNNPGGYMFYMYALASMLTEKPLLVPSEQLIITQEDIAFALSMSNLNTEVLKSEFGKTIGGYYIDDEFFDHFIEYCNFLINEWNQGRTFTNPTYEYGIQSIKPHPYCRYTKPILLLVNHLDFSCGDFFPAILQDNKRAILFGSKTAGAGGFVLEATYPNLFGIKTYTFTGSIATRPSGKTIENLGVTPDIPYHIKENDLKYGYKNYAEALKKAINKMLK